MRFCRFFLMKRYRRSVSRFSTTTTLTSGHLRLQPGFRLLSKKPRQGPQARDLKLSSEHRRNDSVGDLGGAPPLPPAVEEEGFPVYCRPVHPGRLWQGEILENLPQWKLTHEGIVASAAYPGPEQEIPEQLAIEVMPIDHHYVVVMSQDCDLVQDFDVRAEGGESLLNLLLCDAFPEQ